jgi:hypothetical protein
MLNTSQGLQSEITQYVLIQWFRSSFLDYWPDLTGAGKYTNKLGQPIPQSKVKNDIELLNQIAKGWEMEIEKTNHKEELKQQIAKETRDEIKAFSKLPEFNDYGFLNKNFHYKLKLMKLLLRSKIIYMRIIEIIGETGMNELRTQLNGEQIIFNEYSYVHILNRHYQMSSKQADLDKDMHDVDIRTSNIGKTLIEIIKKIEKTGLYVSDNVEKIHLKYKGKIFTTYTKEMNLQKRDMADEKVYRIQTFYPVNNPTELQTIRNDFAEQIIDSELNIYLKI